MNALKGFVLACAIAVLWAAPALALNDGVPDAGVAPPPSTGPSVSGDQAAPDTSARAAASKAKKKARKKQRRLERRQNQRGQIGDPGARGGVREASPARP
jgi:CelD/BcsL family acetyltransferase involved in cellulose biosynthesis